MAGVIAPGSGFPVGGTINTNPGTGSGPASGQVIVGYDGAGRPIYGSAPQTPTGSSGSTSSTVGNSTNTQTTSPSYTSGTQYSPSGQAVGGAAGTLNPFEQQQQLGLQTQAANTASAAQQTASAQALAAQQAALNSAALQQRAALNQQSQEQIFQQLKGLGTPAGVTSGGVGDQTEAAARAAAFARAKDTAGQTSAGAIQALNDLYAGQGLTGSTIEKNALGQQLAGAAGSLGEVNRDMMIQALTRAGQVSDRNYAGNITQRGQNIAAQAPLIGLLQAFGTLY